VNAATTTTQPAIYVHEPSWFAKQRWLLWQALINTHSDNGFGIAKGAAYSSLLSFFPVMTTTTTILVQSRAEEVSNQITRFVFEVVPPGSQKLVERFFVVRGNEPVYLLVLAVILAIWAASGAMMSLIEGFNAAYHVPRGRGPVKDRLMAALLVLCVTLPGVGASALVLSGHRAETGVLTAIGLYGTGTDLAPWIVLLGKTLRFLLAFGATILSTGLLYYLGPNRRVRMRTVWPGAFVAAVLWMLVTSGFSWYVRNIANYNVLYGSIAAVIALLVWMYLLSIIAFVGCEFNVARERLRQAGNIASD
jgi:membrane protein